uniref:Uncharacterized protein n=1 Tax=Monopterus albus TaxID=43700 RepID=A0A3Q3IV73_MONAL|nr:KN motif and ankyrin repeat domain-containing protein 4-like [Monopterus albus]
MEARIKEFDEQPLGEHIRPHLLRASSLPLTVLLRHGSESTDDPGSLWSSRDHLGERNTSCEDIFYSPNNPQPQDCSVLLKHLTETLERVGELEMEVKVIPELRAQISILQEERERLFLGLNSSPYPTSMNGTAESHTLSRCGTMGIKRPEHEGHIMFPRHHSISQHDSNPTHEWRTSTDLDELLTVTSLQAKVAVLEQKLHETGLELQRALGMLKGQQDESRRKDEKIEHLIRSPGVWVHAERVAVDQDGDGTVMRSTEPDYNKVTSSRSPDKLSGGRTVGANGQRSQQHDFVINPMSTERSSLVSVEPREAPAEDAAVVIHHIRKIKRLLEQQWECLCADQHSAEQGEPRRHPDSRVSSLQQEMMELVNILTSYYTQHGHSDGGRTQRGAFTLAMKKDRCAQTSASLRSGAVNEGCKTRASGNVHGQGSENHSIHGDWVQTSLRDKASAQADPEKMERERELKPDGQIVPGKTGSGQTDGGVASAEVEAPEKTARMKLQAPGEQMEGHSGSEIITGGRDSVSAEFMAACQFLSDHMDNMNNPSDDMRKALVVLFQHWFSAAAEEASVASKVAWYLREVQKATPPLLAFLVNLEDDNSNTVLHYSISHSNYGIVSLLLDTGVTDVNLQNNAGYTAVMLASLTAPDGPGGMEVVRKLMELSNVNTRSNKTGQTALHLAVRHGRVVMVRLMLSCGADANIQDNQGTTALMFASERGHTHIARLLLERSQCDLTLTDKHGRTALSIAMQGSHSDTAALLQAHAKARAL